MAAQTTVATANVLYTLGADDARTALGDVLAVEPDLVGLQEWYPTRLRQLRQTGRVALLPGLSLSRRRHGHGRGSYVWQQPLLGGCVVGARADRFELRSSHAA